jgi:hypothetical protein
MDADTLERRLEAGRGGAQAWVAPSVSVRETVDEVREELGTMIIAIANRAFRGDLSERNVPAAIQEDVREMWRRYDYAFHADTTRPRNLEIVTPALREYLIDHFCVWGGADRWRRRLGELDAAGCDGVMFVLGQADQARAVGEIGERLSELGLFEAGVAHR